MTFFGQLALLLVRQVRHREQVVVDERVVAREQLDVALAHPVAARVAHVADVHPPLLWAEHRADDRGAHAVVLARPRRPLEDLAVRDADAREQAVLLFD